LTSTIALSNIARIFGIARVFRGRDGRGVPKVVFRRGKDRMNRFTVLVCLALIGGACGVSQTGGNTATGGVSGSAGVNGTAGATTAAGGGTSGGSGGTTSAGGTGGAAMTGTGGVATGGNVGGGGNVGNAGSGGSGGSGGSIAGSGGTTIPSGGTGGQVLSGVTVTIAGNVVPKEKVIVFLHIGHSNMAGRAVDPVALHDFNFTTSPRLYSYAKGGVWKAALEPLSPDNVTMGKAGPGMSILRAALAVAPPDAYVISIGHGQSGDTGGYCRNYRKGGLFYSAVMDAAMELKGKVTFGGIWGMFGTSEFADMGHVSTFGTCLTGVVTDMRADLGMPALPVLLGDWEAGALGKFLPTTDFAKGVIAQIRSTVAAVQPAAVIPTDGLAIQNPDPAAGTDGVHHYNYAGHKAWGERGVMLLKTSGWAPWAIP
jgi:hypothetical protein